jgi:hypothetical protein
MSKVAGVLLALLAFVPAAQAGVHTVSLSHVLQLPEAQPGEGFPAIVVAIDGDSLIAIVDRAAGRQALLYRRSSNGQWAFSRVLLQSTAPAGQLRASVAMKNSLATFDIEGVTTIWEKVSNNWVRANVDQAGWTLTGGHAISERRVLVGSTGCDVDGVIFEKATDNVWRVTGALPGGTGVCSNEERDVDLNYTYALINDNPLRDVRVYRQNTGSSTWSAAGTIALTGESANRGGPLALQKTIAVAPGSTFYRRTNGVWNHAGSVVPIDYGLGMGNAERVVYRDSVLLTSEPTNFVVAQPYVYVLGASGQFEHVAVLVAHGNVHDLDISGRTVVTASEYPDGTTYVAIYNLPSPLIPPNAISNDFNARDISGFQVSAGSSFTLIGNSSNYFYRQAANVADARALLTESDFRFQSIRAEVRLTTSSNPEAWAGVAFRYVDADNYYYITMNSTAGARLNRRLNGVTTTLATWPAPIPVGVWQDVFIRADGEYLTASIGDGIFLEAIDNTIPQGRAALLTHLSRADFDNLYVSPTEFRYLFSQSFSLAGVGRPFTQMGGTWVGPAPGDTDRSLRQTDISGLALAIAGVPVTDQLVRASVSLDAYGSTQPVPWFGLLARYVDARNYYYLSVRGSGQLQIRKVVNGVTTMLVGRTFSAVPGQIRSYELRALGNQLHAFVNGERIATAVDSDLPVGRYGLGTYRTAATFRSMDAIQP